MTRLAPRSRSPRATALAALAALALLPAAAAARPPAYRFDRPVTRKLDNGLTVLVVPRPRLPMVAVQLVVPAGSASDPAGLEGVAALTAELLRRGTTSRSADAFATDLARLGGSISASATHEYSTMSGAFLARDLSAGLALMSDAVQSPLFDEDELRHARVQMLRVQAQRLMNPGPLADDQAWMFALRGSAYGHPSIGWPRSVGALDRGAVLAFHRAAWRPDHALLAIAGDVTPDAALAAAREWFGGWSGAASAAAPGGAPAPPAEPRVGLIDQPGMPRAEIRLGWLVPGRRDPGRAALALAVAALAGGSDARLAAASRAWAGVSPPRGALSLMRDGGLAMIALSAPADSAAAAIRRVRAALRGFIERPPTEAELEPLRRSFAQSFPLGFETLGGALTQWQSALLDGVPADSVAAIPGRYASVRAADVAAAARRWLDPRHVAVVVEGPASRLRAGLRGIGTVEDLHPETLTATAPPADTMATATPERVARGREAVRRALAAHGGLQRLRALADSRVEGEIHVRISGRELSGEYVVVRKEPYRMFYQTHMLTFETFQVLNGGRGWTQSQVDGDPREADSVGVAGLRAAFASDVPHLLLAAADSAATVVWHGASDDGDSVTDAVDVVTAGGERRRYHFAASDGHLVALDQFESASPVAPMVSSRRYSAYQRVDGVLWAFGEERRTPGDNSIRMVVKSVRLNAGAQDGLFMRPVPGVRREP